jgi:pimeloyl-ACP methyl ester carboxylesterase
MQPDIVTLESGRRVGVYHAGNREAGRTVVYSHCAPGSGAFDPDPVETARHDVHLLALDRPGYGASDPVGPGQWSTIANAAEDIAKVLRGLGSGPVGVAGWSAGGRIALALAANHPDLVDRVALIGSPAPDEEVPWVGEQERAGIDAMRGMAVDDARAIMREQMSQAFPSGNIRDLWRTLLGVSEADATVLADSGAVDRLDAMARQAFARGLDGMIDDILGYTLQPWGFEPGDVRAGTLLLYGAQDPVVTDAHGRWFQQQIPNARLEVMPDIGHLLVVPGWGRVLDHVAGA